MSTDHSNCRNSNESPGAAERRGACGDCAGRGQLVSNFAGRHRHVKCPGCNGSGRK
jgi:DnaJ-class molecular chaperone